MLQMMYTAKDGRHKSISMRIVAFSGAGRTRCRNALSVDRGRMQGRSPENRTLLGKAMIGTVASIFHKKLDAS